MTVIELGEFNVPSEPGEPGPRSEFSPRAVRRGLLAAIVVAGLLLFGAGSPPATPLVHDVWSVPMTEQDVLSARPDGIFVIRAAGASPARLTSYEPSTGRIRWSRPVDSGVTWMYPGEEAGLLLIPGDEKFADVEYDDGSQGQIGYGGTTTAFDAVTGERLWKVPGEVQAAASASVLLGERDSAGTYVSVRLVDARTGADLWRRPAGGALHLTVRDEGPAPTLIVLTGSAGETTVLRYADGSVLRRRTLPWSPSQPDKGVETYLSIAGDLVLVSRNEPDRAVVTAYRTGDLERLWEIETSSYSYLTECGPVLCHVDGVALRGLDPRTGRQVWTRPGAGGSAVLIGDRLLAGDNADPPRQVLVDPATGAQIGPGSVGYPMRYEPFEGRLLLLHRIYGAGPLRDAVDYLDMDTGRVIRVGQLTVTADVQQGWQCDSIGRYLACQRDGRLVVTAVG